MSFARPEHSGVGCDNLSVKHAGNIALFCGTRGAYTGPFLEAKHKNSVIKEQIFHIFVPGKAKRRVL